MLWSCLKFYPGKSGVRYEETTSGIQLVITFIVRLCVCINSSQLSSSCSGSITRLWKEFHCQCFPPTFQIIYNYYQYCCLVAKLCSALLRPYGLLLPIRLHCPWYFPGKNTGAGCHFLLQRIFPTQDSNCISCNSWIGRWVLYSWVTREAPTVITS